MRVALARFAFTTPMALVTQPQDYFHPIGELDIRRLPLRPVEAFVLSRVDGKSGPKDIAHSTALSETRVSQILQRLLELGAISRGSCTSAPASKNPDTRLPSAEQVACIEGLYAKRDATYYDLLGVEPTDSAETIKQAYYDYAGRLHPDRFYGVDLGDLRPTLLAVFQRLTEAYEVLGKDASRRRYDAGLRVNTHTD